MSFFKAEVNRSIAWAPKILFTVAPVLNAVRASHSTVLKFFANSKAILLAETDKSNNGVITPEIENKMLMKAAKQRKESADIFKKENRADLAQRELLQLEVISQYLPKQLSEEEVKAEVVKIIDQVGAKGPQDLGKVMGTASKALAGKADGKMISDLVKKLLVP